MPMGGGKRQVLVPSWWCTWPAAEMGARLVPAHGRRCTPILQPVALPHSCRRQTGFVINITSSFLFCLLLLLGRNGAKSSPARCVELNCWLSIRQKGRAVSGLNPFPPFSH